MKAVSQWSSIRSAASFANKADDEQTRASSLSEMILGVQTSRERHRIRDRRSALCIYRVVLRASPFKSRQGLRLHRAEAALRLDAFRLKHERQHRSVMSEEEEEVVEEEGIHYVEKTLFYWFSVREMANVLRDNLASIKTPYCPLRCEYSHALRASHSLTITTACRKHASVMYTTSGAVMSHD